MTTEIIKISQNLPARQDVIPSMSDAAIEKCRALEAEILKFPQINLMTNHIIHGGMYARTMMFPAGSVITGALIKRATILIISGSMLLFVGDETVELDGYHVFACGAHRKQAGVARSDVWLTMLFTTEADQVWEAENECSDEADQLFCRKHDAINSFVITEEK